MKFRLSAFLFFLPSICFAQEVALHLSQGGSVATGNCFSVSDNVKIAPAGWNIWQEGTACMPATPTGNDASCVLYPQTAYTSQLMDLTVNSQQNVSKVLAEEIATGCLNAFNPACATNANPSAIPHTSNCRLGYSSYQNSEAADQAWWSYSAGMANTISSGTGAGLGWGDLAGSMTIYGNCGNSLANCMIDAVNYPNIITQYASICTHTVGGVKTAEDIVVLPPARLVDNTNCSSCEYGLFYVNEPLDDRPCLGSFSTLTHMTALAAITTAANSINGTTFKTAMLANKINTPFQQGFHNGLCPVQDGAGSNVVAILALLSPWELGLDENVSSAVTSWQAQLCALDVNYATDGPNNCVPPTTANVGVRVALTRTATDVASLYAVVTSPVQYFGAWIWPRGQQQGGVCGLAPNQVTEKITGITSP